MKWWDYLVERLNERSSLMTIGQAMAWSLALPYPFSLACLVVGIAAAMVPDGLLKANAPAE